MRGTIIIHQPDSDLLDALEMILKLEGFVVYGFIGYPVGLVSVTRDLKADIVILDRYIHGAECIALLREIRQANQVIPVLVTGSQDDMEQFSDRFGFSGYIEMPFDLLTFYNAILKHLPTNPAPH